MASNAVKPRAVWSGLKIAAQEHGSLVEGLAKIALSAWGENDAGTKLSSDRGHREAFVASLVGAAAVDLTIDKLAADGTLNTPEAEYLRDLNAEAALKDLGQFQKSANALHAAAELIARNPTAVGAVAGMVAGAGFGAYADDENRLRGAVRFGLPGALIGGIAGHGLEQHREETLRRLKEEAEKAMAEAHKREMDALALKAQIHKLRGF